MELDLKVRAFYSLNHDLQTSTGDARRLLFVRCIEEFHQLETECLNLLFKESTAYKTRFNGVEYSSDGWPEGIGLSDIENYLIAQLSGARTARKKVLSILNPKFEEILTLEVIEEFMTRFYGSLNYRRGDEEIHSTKLVDTVKAHPNQSISNLGLGIKFNPNTIRFSLLSLTKSCQERFPPECKFDRMEYVVEALCLLMKKYTTALTLLLYLNKTEIK